MKLSVIVPVFRTEATLKRCLDSILNQNLPDFELIIVNDGSDDGSGLICEQYAEKDNRIRVIHKENGGLSSARNKGIALSQGEYITFVDSDDELASGTYKDVLSEIGDSDIIEYPIAGRLSLESREYSDMKEYWLCEKVYTHTYVWNKIFRRTLFDGVRFPEGKVFEDAYILPHLLNRSRKVKTTGKGSYLYHFNPNGITATADGHKLAQLLEAHLTSNMPIDDRFYMHLANIQIDVYEQNGGQIKLPRRHVKLNGLNNKQKVKAIIINLLGINYLCKISKILHLASRKTKY